MTNDSLARSYLEKATVRLEVLALLFSRKAWSDVVREAQEVVELALKGMLRQVGVEPPHWHDVGSLLIDHRDRFPPDLAMELETLATISSWLRKEREFALYGDIDFIPTEQYGRSEAERAVTDARRVVAAAARVIEVPPADEGSPPAGSPPS